MKTTTLLFALAISATLMMTTGCKHGRVGKDPITGTTIIPGQTSDSNAGKTGSNGSESVQPIRPESTPPPITTTVPTAPATGDALAFPTNTSEFDPAFDRGTRDETIFAKDTIYFELDSAVVRSSEQSKLEDIAAFFKSDKNKDGLQIEGHCDERGTEQYNMALGDKRALAVREYLINLGVEPARIRTVSFGEAKPVDPGHNEAAWSKNRRGVSVLYHAPTAAAQ